jgi:hypothetical protein
VLELVLAGRSGGGGVRGAIAVDGDRVEVLTHPTDSDEADVAVHRLALDAGQADEKVGRVAGEIAESVCGDNALHAAGLALDGDRLRVALALTRDAVLAESVDAGGEGDVAAHGGAGGHRDLECLRVKARVRNLQHGRAGHEVSQSEATLLVSEDLAVRTAEEDAGARQGTCGGGVGNGAGEHRRAGCLNGGRGGLRREADGQAKRQAEQSGHETQVRSHRGEGKPTG